MKNREKKESFLLVSPCISDRTKLLCDVQLLTNRKKTLFDARVLKRLLENYGFTDIKVSEELGVAKFNLPEETVKEIIIFDSGRIRIKKAENREDAQRIIKIVTRILWGALLCGKKVLLNCLPEGCFLPLPGEGLYKDLKDTTLTRKELSALAKNMLKEVDESLSRDILAHDLNDIKHESFGYLTKSDEPLFGLALAGLVLNVEDALSVLTDIKKNHPAGYEEAKKILLKSLDGRIVKKKFDKHMIPLYLHSSYIAALVKRFKI